MSRIEWGEVILSTAMATAIISLVAIAFIPDKKNWEIPACLRNKPKTKVNDPQQRIRLVSDRGQSISE